MTRKHFKAIAKAINYNSIYSNNSSRRIIKKDALIDELCVVFKQLNNRFDSNKFKDACNNNN